MHVVYSDRKRERKNWRKEKLTHFSLSLSLDLETKQDNQRAWLTAFEDRCGIEAEVLKVVEPGSKRPAAAGASSRK